MMPLIPNLARALYRTLGVALLACASAHADAQSAAQGTPGRRASVIQSVDVASGKEAGAAQSAVTIQGDGPLPAPVVGVLDAPPRIYLDFTGVRLGSRVAAEGQDSMVRGVRLAQHSVDPLVARVVFDLHKAVAHRIDASERESGRVVVLLGATASAALAAPPLPARSRDAGRYLAQVSGTLVRLHALRRVIGSIDGRVVGAAADLPAVAVELDSMGRTLGAMKVSESLATTHDLLMRSCALGARAARMRHESSTSGDATAALNAASAAAGALILLDRATRDLGYVPPQ